MKPRNQNPFNLAASSSSLRGLFTVTLSVLAAGQVAQAAPIVWNAPSTISGTVALGTTDILTAGSLNYAYNFNNTNRTVNGVTFTGTNSTTTIGTDVTLASGFTSAPTTFGNTGGTYNALPTEYKEMIRGGNYATGAKAVTLQNLTSGRVYATQVWINDSRAGAAASRTSTLTSTGGNTVTLDNNSTNAGNGVGQYSTGRFIADAATQVMTVQSTSVSTGATVFNAFQVREVTNIGNWVGSGGASWDASSTNNFASNLFSAALNTTTFTAAKVPLNSVVFADTYWSSNVQTAVTQTNVTVEAAGVSASAVYFDNSAINYTIGNASGSTGITGGTSIVKSGSGTVTLSDGNTYTGVTTVTGGTLRVNGTHISSTSGSNYTVSNTGTTLGGNGRLAINGNVSVGSGAYLSPGASIGTLTLDGVNKTGNVLTMTTGSKFGFELAGNGGTPDRLDFWNYVSGDLVLNTNTIDLSLLGTQAAGTYNVDIFRFFSDGGGTAATHAFGSGLSIGTLGTGISSASIDWNGTGDNNQTIALTYTVVPEPRAALLGGLGMLALLRRRRN